MCDLFDCRPSSIGSAPPKLTSRQRRAFLQGIATLPLAAVLADPVLAQSAAARLEAVTITSASGNRISGGIGVPETTPAPAVLLIHEWWGLNDQIKAVTAELASQGFLSLAVNLYGREAATTREGALSLMRSLDGATATDMLISWVDYLKSHPGGNGKVGTLGWCFGGGWSLNTSLVADVDATVVYYGNVAKTSEQLGTLDSPVLGHFGTLDQRINEKMVGDFERAMAAAGKTDLEIHWYTAGHAFANPTGGLYDEDDAALAWSRTLTFLHKHLG